MSASPTPSLRVLSAVFSRGQPERRASAPVSGPAASASAMAATPAISGTRQSTSDASLGSTPVSRPSPPSARQLTLIRLVSRKKATVRRAMWPPLTPPRRRIQAPRARPPAPPTDSTELAASSDRPISVLVRQLILRQKTVRKAITYDAHERTWSTAANTSQPGSPPSNRSLREASPGSSTTSAMTTATIATTIATDLRMREAVNSSGMGSAAISGEVGTG